MQDIWWFLSEISQPTSSYEPSWKLLHKTDFIAGFKSEVRNFFTNFKPNNNVKMNSFVHAVKACGWEERNSYANLW